MSQTIDEIRDKKKRNDEFSVWRKEWAKKMPDLAKRVFSLRETSYPGCGFHWHLEKNLGYCIFMLNNYDDASLYHGDDALSLQLVLKVQVEGLVEDVEKHETL